MKKTFILISALLNICLIGFGQTNVTTTGGTANYVPKFSGAYTIVNSTIYDNGYVGIGTTSPTKTLSLIGTAAKTFWMERHTTANTAGNNLTVQAGGATSGATNKNGGNLILSSGISTGTGSSNLILGIFPAGSSGTGDNTFAEQMRITGIGYIGIGTTAPNYKLHLHSTEMYDGGGQLATSLGTTTFQMTNATTGTASDAGFMINVLGQDANISVNNSNGGFLKLTAPTIQLNSTSSTMYLSSQTGGVSMNMSDYSFRTTTTANVMKILAGGNIGIATSTPGSKLQVYGNSAIGYSASTAAPANGLAVYGNVGIGTITVGSPLQVNGGAAIGYNASTTAPSNGLAVYGNVGIGTTSPGVKLEVNGTSGQTLKIVDGNQGTNRVLASDANGVASWKSLSTLYITTNNCTTTNKILKMTGSTTMDCSQIYDDGTNVGIGTTSSPTAKLEIDGDRLILKENSKTLTLDADSSGKIMIGGSTNVVWFKTGSDYNTIKCGKIWAQTEVKVQNLDPWPDYVFDKEYSLMTLPEMENFINVNKHLPNVPSSKEVEKDGISLGKMDATLLQKVEELTLYVIDLKKENDALKKVNDDLGKRVNALEVKK